MQVWNYFIKKNKMKFLTYCYSHHYLRSTPPWTNQKLAKPIFPYKTRSVSSHPHFSFSWNPKHNFLPHPPLPTSLQPPLMRSTSIGQKNDVFFHLFNLLHPSIQTESIKNQIEKWLSLLMEFSCNFNLVSLIEQKRYSKLFTHLFI